MTDYITDRINSIESQIEQLDNEAFELDHDTDDAELDLIIREQHELEAEVLDLMLNPDEAEADARADARWEAERDGE